MTKKNQERVCKNCRFYLEHYVKLDTQLLALDIGHCVNHELNAKQTRNKYALYENCKFWETNKIKKTKRKQSIEKLIIRMEQQLSEIAAILKDDACK